MKYKKQILNSYKTDKLAIDFPNIKEKFSETLYKLKRDLKTKFKLILNRLRITNFEKMLEQKNIKICLTINPFLDISLTFFAVDFFLTM